jgi:hypothetical protein
MHEKSVTRIKTTSFCPVPDKFVKLTSRKKTEILLKCIEICKLKHDIYQNMFSRGSRCLSVANSHFIHHTPGRSPRGRRRYLHNTQQTRQTNIHALSGIRSRDPRNQAVADPQLTHHKATETGRCVLFC